MAPRKKPAPEPAVVAEPASPQPAMTYITNPIAVRMPLRRPARRHRSP